MKRTCSICHIEKDLSCFSTFHNGNNPNYIDTRCKECKNKNTRIHYTLKREEYLAKGRLRDARRKCKQHGVTLEWLNSKTAEQNGRCAVCNKEESQRLCIDHDHTTNTARGLLCKKCNFLIGLAQDNPQILLQAAKYLQSNCLNIKDLGGVQL